MKKMAVILSVVVLCAVGAKAQPDEPLKLVQTIPLSGLQDGDFDHFALDLPGQRLFLCAEENGAVEVIDLHEGKVVQTLRDTKTPHSMAYDTESKKLFVLDEGPPNRVAIFEGNPLKLSDSIPTDAHTDASIFDAANHMLYAGNGGRMAHEDFCLLTARGIHGYDSIALWIAAGLQVQALIVGRQQHCRRCGDRGYIS